MTRRRRIPGTASRGFEVEVATGGDPVGALMRAAAVLPVRRGEVWQIDVCHDDDCPALDVGPMSRCRCEIVSIRGRRAP